jgi:hypothetical protein
MPGKATEIENLCISVFRRENVGESKRRVKSQNRNAQF